MLFKTCGKLTISTFGGLALGGDYDNTTFRRFSLASWIPYDEVIAIECIVAPNSLYRLLTSVDQVKAVSEALELVNPVYLRGGLRLVREDGSCIDFSNKAQLDNFFDISKDIFDLEFLQDSEGRTLVVVVPANSTVSGLTIGCGVDLGWKNADDLLKIGVPQTIIDRLEPCFGLRGGAARKMLTTLTDKTLGLTENEVDLLSEKVIQAKTAEIISEYNKVTTGITFDKIPYKTRTAIIDIFYQYGFTQAPRSWGFITSNDWQGLYGELMNFQDGHATRRHREAALVIADINENMFIYH